MIARDRIPPITHPLGRHWDQPAQSEIVLERGVAFVTPRAFASLCEYSSTMPTGVYEGKMWKAYRRVRGQFLWLLMWYDVGVPDVSCRICWLPLRVLQL